MRRILQISSGFVLLTFAVMSAAAEPSTPTGVPSGAPSTTTSPEELPPDPMSPGGASEPATEGPVPTEPIPATPAPQAAPSPSASPPRTASPSPSPTAPAPNPEEAAIPLERDTVGDHFTISAAAGATFPFGSLAQDRAQSDLVGPGFWLGADLLYGVSRAIAVGVYGEFATPSGKNAGAGRDFTSFAVGPVVRYYLVQGLKFDPWLSAGLGFRRLSGGGDAFTGLDWLRLQVGGDFYPVRNLGFGPVAELSLGTFLGQRNGDLGSKSVNGQFVISGRIVFDAPGK